MKIIYIANARIPTEKAHGWQICKMCEQLALCGAEVELWASQRTNTIKQDVFSYYRLKKNFSFKYIKSFDFIKYAKILGPLASWLQRLFFMLKLAKELPREDVTIFSRDPEVVFRAKQNGLVAVYENHDGLGRKKNIILKLIRKVDKIITTNKYIKKQLVDNGINSEKILVAPHGVDFESFDLDLKKEEALDKLKLEIDLKNKLKNKKVLLYTGNFRTMGEDKGIEDSIKALKLLNNKEELLVAIGGSEKDINYYREIIKKEKLEDQTILLGRQSQEELGLWQKVADVLLMPFPDKAHYREHMAPLKMFEYMVARRPIIASDLPSIRAVLNDDISYFCKPDDPQDLADKINHVLQNPRDADDKINKVYNESQKYRWDKRAEKIIEFIK